MLRACRFTALLLAALALSTVPAHAPQVPEYLSLWFLVWMMTRGGTIPGVYGHAGGFALQLLAFSALAVSVLVDTPKRAA